MPAPEPPREFAGGYTEIAFQGVARDVLHCDVTSLYPSLMLACGLLSPARTSSGVFPRCSRDLRDLPARGQARWRGPRAATEDRAHYDALQTTFKILINSFYGYLGFSQAHFNDFDVAEPRDGRGAARSSRR